SIPFEWEEERGVPLLCLLRGDVERSFSFLGKGLSLLWLLVSVGRPLARGLSLFFSNGFLSDGRRSSRSENLPSVDLWVLSVLNGFLSDGRCSPLSGLAANFPSGFGLVVLSLLNGFLSEERRSSLSDRSENLPSFFDLGALSLVNG